MLRRLELVGFKSFADKTVFEFGDGVTGIVGPNGSGKSNIVDAIRWIMGEQSAKSLRGGEMADVIFNGSASRRSVGLAEVTLTFDNRQRQLSIDADEVQITRRVYRNSEGAYLINGQVCRLRDIKDMFLGSGAGNDAYCIIAQGRVDALLQASTRDRRIIFEEAAGISRFKAKKIESLRKLERVDQNLQRLRDIIDEVEKQLRSVKLQASKAQRYQEHSNRLRELRLALGLQEYQQLTERLDVEQQALGDLRGELDQRAARAGACEAEAERLEIFLADLDDTLRDQEALLARLVQQIGTEESTVTHETALSADLEVELLRTRTRLSELTVHVASLGQAARQAQAELDEATRAAQQQRGEAGQRQQLLQDNVQKLHELHAQIATDKAEHLEQMRQAAHWQNEAVAAHAHVDNLRREGERLRLRSARAEESLASIDVELQELLQAEAELQGRLGAARQALQAQKQRHDELVALRDRTIETISQLRQQRSGALSRIEVLEGLIRSHEGLGSGVREVIGLVEAPEAGPWSTVIGMIADFLTVKREYAPLIDLALGDWAQRFVVRDMARLAAALSSRGQPLSGRVSFLPLQAAETVDDPALAELRRNRLVQVSLLSRVRQPGEVPDHAGLVAPAEQLVSCDHPELGDLPAQLLGRTLIVRDLTTARSLSGHAAGFRLVTLQGELLEPDGTLTVGTYHAESGILSRKSELHELREQSTRLDERIAEAEQDLVSIRDQLHALDVESQQQQEAIEVLTEQAADLRTRVQRHRDRRQGLHEEVAVSQEEMQRIEQEVGQLDQQYRQVQVQAAQAEAQVQVLHERMREADDDIRQREQARQEQQEACTRAQVALAQVEERFRALESRHRQLAHDHEQRRQELLDAQRTLAESRARLIESQLATLRASALLARLFLDKEEAQRQVAGMIGQRDVKRQERGRLTQQAQTVRTEWRKHQETMHQRELAATDIRHQRDGLIQRLQEDYQVDLAALHLRSKMPATDHTAGTDRKEEDALASVFGLVASLQAAEAQQEIEELRRKLHRLGSVNLEALAELEELQTRAAALQTQYDDLIAAKKSLEEIIGKINADSRRLFTETFEAIRVHFQELFRKLFGGGMADVILEDEQDVLESGIEINARPPGKELRSISLMSGGEKTLTAVALLLAIFRSKPSPFCVLDEVDAALDEANIGRFTVVLREFLDRSQFIIVTHSKKTMASADVLYGITMQESGISKQVAIRFEDWIDDQPPRTEVA